MVLTVLTFKCNIHENGSITNAVDVIGLFSDQALRNS